ncbi:MAG: RNA-binding S4 domain-containing protein, partial [Xanthomonadales bacterium]|nr:RNA-binding S4 domain-containing protein [Xanthomonadales bacterium]
MSDVRLDKWLWAARLFKTRALARAAVVGGKVDLNGHRAKPAKTLEPGDRLRVQRGQDVFVLTVRDISDRRGPASVAQQLYEEDPDSIAQREALAA